MCSRVGSVASIFTVKCPTDSSVRYTYTRIRLRCGYNRMLKPILYRATTIFTGERWLSPLKAKLAYRVD